jgi:hypothetical protein
MPPVFCNSFCNKFCNKKGLLQGYLRGRLQGCRVQLKHHFKSSKQAQAGQLPASPPAFEPLSSFLSDPEGDGNGIDQQRRPPSRRSNWPTPSGSAHLGTLRDTVWVLGSPKEAAARLHKVANRSKGEVPGERQLNARRKQGIEGLEVGRVRIDVATGRVEAQTEARL